MHHDGKHCPACGVDVGVWPIFAAGLPNRIRCPQCNARLGYRGIGGVLVVLLLVLAAVVAVAYVVTGSLTGDQRLIVLLAVMLGAWVPVELVVAWYLREHKVLDHRSGGAPPAEKEEA